jgi:hypothetical protein
MALPFRPRVVYGATTFNFSLPSKLWTPRPETFGKSRIATSGITETFVRNRHQLVRVPLRFTEAELSDVYAWIAWCHANGMGTFTWRFDQDDAATAHTMYLQEPMPEGAWEPTRDETDASVWLLEVVLRVSTDALVDVAAFA